jgi:hypothetical protein
MTEAIVIPEKYVELCKEVARLAKEADLNSAGLTLTPGFDSDWRHPIRMNWQSGRHGEESARVIITSEVTVRAELQPNPGHKPPA